MKRIGRAKGGHEEGANMEAGKQEVGERGGSPTQTVGEDDARGGVQQTVIVQLCKSGIRAGSGGGGSS